MSGPHARGLALAAKAAAFGVVLWGIACALPGIGLFRGSIGNTVFSTYGERILGGQVPYRDFSLEYPPGALPAFALPALGAAADYDRWFMGLQALCGAATVAAVAFGLVALGATGGRLYSAVAFTALAPLALGPLTLQRFDLWPVALATVGVAALLWRRERLALGALGLGTSAKLFPLLIVPFALRYVPVGLRRRAVGALVTALAIVVLPALLLGPGGLRYALERQSGRGLHIESLGSAALLAAHELGLYAPTARFEDGAWNLVGTVPDLLAIVLPLAGLAAFLAVWILFARTDAGAHATVLASAAALAGWIALGKVLSPQFLLWVLPLVALLASVRLAAVLLAALGVSQLVYPHLYEELVAFERTPIVLLCLRDALVLVLAAALVARLEREGVPQEIRRQRHREHAGEPVLLDGGEGHRPHGVPRL